MTEKVVEMKVKEKGLSIKNFDLEAMQKPQVRMVDGKTNFSPGSLEWIASCRDLPTGFSFELKKLRPRIRDVDTAYRQQKQELIEKYADRDEKGDLIQNAPNVFRFTTKAQWFQKEYAELLDLESELGGKKLEINFKDIPDRLLSADDFASLECIMEFVKEKEDG